MANLWLEMVCLLFVLIWVLCNLGYFPFSSLRFNFPVSFTALNVPWILNGGCLWILLFWRGKLWIGLLFGTYVYSYKFYTFTPTQMYVFMYVRALLCMCVDKIHHVYLVKCIMYFHLGMHVFLRRMQRQHPEWYFCMYMHKLIVGLFGFCFSYWLFFLVGGRVGLVFLSWLCLGVLYCVCI